MGIDLLSYMLGKRSAGQGGGEEGGGDEGGGDEGGGVTVLEIEGTLAAPWGELSPGEIKTAVEEGSATALLFFEGEARTLGLAGLVLLNAVEPAEMIRFCSARLSAASGGSVAFNALYRMDGVLLEALLLEREQITSMLDYAGAFSTRLVLIRHPRSGEV